MKVFYFTMLLSIFCCVYSQSKKAESSRISESSIRGNEKKDVRLSDLKYLLNSLNHRGALETRLSLLDFNKKFEDVYTSSEMVTSKKPKHWITIARMGSISNVDFKTTDKVIWMNIIKELKAVTRPEKFTDGTSDIAERYSIKGYKVETFEPRNGINLDLNNLYEVVIMKPGTKN